MVVRIVASGILAVSIAACGGDDMSGGDAGPGADAPPGAPGFVRIEDHSTEPRIELGRAFVAGDWDDDGTDDVAVNSSSVNSPLVRIFSGISGAPLQDIPWQSYGYYDGAGGFDFDADGAPDLLFIAAPAMSADHHIVWISGADRSLHVIQSTVWTIEDPRHIANIGDVDGDGADDIYVEYSYSETSTFWGGLKIISSQTLAEIVSHRPGLEVADSSAWNEFGLRRLGDLDGDQIADYALYAPAALGGSHVISGAALRTGALTEVRPFAPPPRLSLMPVGDLTADGHDDLAVEVTSGEPLTILSGADDSIALSGPTLDDGGRIIPAFTTGAALATFNTDGQTIITDTQVHLVSLPDLQPLRTIDMADAGYLVYYKVTNLIRLGDRAWLANNDDYGVSRAIIVFAAP